MKKKRTLIFVILVLVAFISGAIFEKMDWNSASRSEYAHVDFEYAII